MPSPARTIRGPGRRAATVFPRWLERELVNKYHTAAPGIVEEYDPATKRARVSPALAMLEEGGALKDRAVLLDVPVLHPSGGGYVVHLPIAAGDPVMLLFSERGLTAFKQTYARSAPDIDALMSERDAVAIPGFGALEVSPVEPGALCIQREDGTVSIVVTEGDVTINVPAGSNVHLGGGGGEELATRSFVARYFNTHVHPSPTGPTGPPTFPAPVTPGVDLTTKTKGE